MLPLLFHGLFHEPEETQNVIMFTMFAGWTVTKSLSRERAPPAVNTYRSPDRQVSSFIIVLSITQTKILDKQSSEFLCCQSVTPFQITLCSRGPTLVADHIAASFLAAPLVYICFQQSHQLNLLISHRGRVKRSWFWRTGLYWEDVNNNLWL